MHYANKNLPACLIILTLASLLSFGCQIARVDEEVEKKTDERLEGLYILKVTCIDHCNEQSKNHSDGDRDGDSPPRRFEITLLSSGEHYAEELDTRQVRLRTGLNSEKETVFLSDTRSPALSVVRDTGEYFGGSQITIGTLITDGTVQKKRGEKSAVNLFI